MRTSNQTGIIARSRDNLLCLLLALLAVFALDSSAQQEWDLQRDRNGIQVYTKAVAGSPYAAVRTVTVLDDIRLSALVALLEDVTACSEWADKCAESFVYERVTETESYIYTHNALPFPVKDRDHLSHVRWSQDTATLTVIMESTATEGIMEKRSGLLRITESDIVWRFVPRPTGMVEIINEAHINPGSSLPAWVTNMLLIDTPYQTMQSFITEARKPKYQNASVNFVREPNTR